MFADDNRDRLCLFDFDCLFDCGDVRSYASMSDNPEVKREFVVDCLVHGDIQIVLKHNSVLGSSYVPSTCSR